MFKFLKEKIKNWTSKIEEEKLTETSKKEKTSKKETKKQTQNKTKKPKEKKQSLKKPTKEKPDTKKKTGTSEEKTEWSLFSKKLTPEKFNKLFEELEIILLQNNVAYEVVEKIKSSLEEKLTNENIKNIDIKKSLKETIKDILINPPNIINNIKKSLKEKKPYVIILVGINGSGKTTTIAKLANFFKKEKFSICLAAADTFRAASIEQIEQHSKKLGIKLIKKDYGVDPAAVGFEAIKYAKKNKIDIVLIDTAGRMNTKDSLMKELEKIIRVNSPDMTIFVGESITGNDATQQAKIFSETIPITGIILSKADIDEKGGTAISISHITKKPILFIGTGQEYKDIKIFNKEDLIKKLF